MSAIAQMSDVSKRYRLGAERSNWRALIPGPLGEVSRGEHFDALRSVSLEIHAGESIGIIGENGAGKSTLLKILAGTIRPTSGFVEVSGRVASVIELGVGFDPDLTGAENLRFAGTLFGATAAEVDRRYEQIVDFADLHEFMDTPVKRYSTGMRARLGFSLATSFDADLIILDEVLSVGDWAFQQKCLARIRELHEAGAAIVAVSHSNWMLTQICERAILLERGLVTAAGDVISVVEAYIGETTVTDPDKDENFPVAAVIPDPAPSSPIRLTNLVVDPPEIEPNDRLRFRVRLEVDEPVDGELVMSIYTMGRAVFADPEVGPAEPLQRPGVWEVTGTTVPLPFSPGAFRLRLAVVDQRDPEDFLQEHARSHAKVTESFRVSGRTSSRPGLLFDTQWRAVRVEDDGPDATVGFSVDGPSGR